MEYPNSFTSNVFTTFIGGQISRSSTVLSFARIFGLLGYILLELCVFYFSLAWWLLYGTLTTICCIDFTNVHGVMFMPKLR